MKVQACNPSTLRAEAGRSSEFLSSKLSSLQSQMQESQRGRREEDEVDGGRNAGTMGSG